MIFVYLPLIFFSRIIAFCHSKRTYVLSRDCQMPSNYGSILHYSNTKYLRIDNLEGGIVLYSHELTHTGSPNPNSSSSSVYPYGFSCEVLVHSPVPSAKIMLRVEHFYVPSDSDDCVENYLYVFDSNTSKSKAMTEAGGERGLCRANFPHRPIFTTNPYVCIAFHTSTRPPPVTSTKSPGFSLVLTAILDTDTHTCPSGHFYCDSRPTQSHPAHPLNTGLSIFADQRSPVPPTVLSGSALSNRDASSRIGYCISEKAVCDGIVNCADARDESLNRCEAKGGSKSSNWWTDGDTPSNGWLSGFLSLGIPASIAVAVSAIITFTVCIGAVICCCNRCCKPSTHTGPYSRAFGPFISNLQYPGSAWASTTGTAASPTSRGNLRFLSNGSHQFSFSPYPQSALSQHYYGFGAVPPQFSDQKLRFEAQNDLSSIHSHLHEPKVPSSAMCYSTGPSRSTNSTVQPPSQPRGTARGGALPTMSVHHVQPHSAYPALCVSSSIPALGTSSSPGTYLQDQSSTERCCYTPPPYGACAVPPASSVTASSSRTGTSVGITGPVTLGIHGSACLSGSRAASNSGYVAFTSADVGGSADNGSGAELRTAGSIGMLYGPQLSGGGNSALHTNTPVETISQTGGDLISNGGIVYLGELIPPYANDASDKLRSSSCASGVMGAGSTTTGSGGSSRGRARCAQRLQSNDSSAHFPFSHPILNSQGNPGGYRRTTAPSHRQHRHRYHRSNDFVRTGSSGSHTPASSRCDPSSSKRSDANNANIQTVSNIDPQSLNNAVVAPIQL
ncbi:unnamed protein product [Dicrocoelium dendriticum]|nr:unnamed protein product [Dicrocoelium dendriticum]